MSGNAQENALLESIDILTLLDLLPGNLYIEDLEGNLLFCNNAQLKTQKAADFADTHKEGVYAPLNETSRAQIRANNQKVIELGQAMEFIEEPTIKGRKHFFLSHKAPLYQKDTDKIIGVYGYSVNITEQKKNAALLKKTNTTLQHLTESQSRFIAKLSHDIRTPFAGLMGMIDLMMNKSHDPELHAYGQYAKESVHELIAYFEKIVESEKILNQKAMVTVNKTVDLASYLEDIIKIYKPMAKMKHLEIRLYCDVAKPVKIAANVLSTIIMNLVGNAVKYTQQGHIEITATTTIQRNQPMLSFIVRDTGPGISYALRKKIFDPFYRAHQVSENENKGAGLGLAIARRSAMKIKGQLRLLAGSEKGAAFECLAPYTFSHETIESITQSKDVDTALPPTRTMSIPTITQNKPVTKKGINITLVEDNAVVALATTALIEHHYPKANLTHHEHPQGLLDACEQGYRPDLVILDIGLPDINGDKLAVMLRQRKLISATTPLVAVTGHGHEMNHDHVLSVFDQVLVKPITQDQIMTMLKDHLTYNQYLYLTQKD